MDTRTPHTRLRRRLGVGVATAGVALAATVALGTSPAAAAGGGYMLTKGAGTYYSNSIYVDLGVKPGTTVTFFYKIVNNTATINQYRVVAALQTPGINAYLYSGSTKVANRYYTPPIAPGKTLILNVKMQAAADLARTVYTTKVTLEDPDANSVLSTHYAVANAAPGTGTGPNDLFLKTGSQPFVGGDPTLTELESSVAKLPSTGVPYTVRLQNDSATDSAPTLHAFAPSCGAAVVVKAGSVDVTALVFGPGYTVNLAPGAHKDLVATIKLPAATACTAVYQYFLTQTTAVYAHVLVAA